MVLRKEIFALEPIADDQFQPASLDLRLGPTAYRVRASFLPGPGARSRSKLDEFAMHAMDITRRRACSRRAASTSSRCSRASTLRHRTSAMGNPKSSTGRLDIFTRLITDQRHRLRPRAERLQRPLYAEVSPRTFSVLVRQGSRLNQIRFRRGKPIAQRRAACAACSRSTAWSSRPRRARRRARGQDRQRPAGLASTSAARARAASSATGRSSHAGLVDIDRIGHYDVDDYWEPVPRRRAAA